MNFDLPERASDAPNHSSPKPRSSRRQFPLGNDSQLNIQVAGELTLARLQALLGGLLKQSRWAEKQGMSVATFEAWVRDASATAKA